MFCSMNNTQAVCYSVAHVTAYNKSGNSIIGFNVSCSFLGTCYILGMLLNGSRF